MALVEFCRGRWGAVILAVAANGTRPAADFLADLDPKDKAKVKALLQRYADFGFISNREKFKKVEDDLFEFKSFQIRLFCYLKGRQVVITHGARKKRDVLSPADIERAKRIRIEYENSQDNAQDGKIK